MGSRSINGKWGRVTGYRVTRRPTFPGHVLHFNTVFGTNAKMPYINDMIVCLIIYLFITNIFFAFGLSDFQSMILAKRFTWDRNPE